MSKNPPPRQPQPPEVPAPPSAIREGLAHLGVDKTTELVALIAGVLASLHTLFFGAGLLTHSSREHLLGLYVPLIYPTQSAFLLSLDILWSVPIDSLWALFSGQIWIFGAFIPLLPLALALRRNAPARRALSAHLACLLLLIVAVRLYQAALFPSLLPGGVAPRFVTEVSPAWTSQAEQHVISWLTGGNPEQSGNLKALAGLVGWLLAMSGAATWLINRRTVLRRGSRLALSLAHLLIGLAILGLVPRAYTVAAWGLSYPRVHVRQESKCDDALRLALAGRCCAFDVSAGGTPRTTLQVGEQCPGGEGFRIWSEEEARCFVLGAREAIHDGCL